MQNGCQIYCFLDESHILHVRADAYCGGSRDEGHTDTRGEDSACTFAIDFDKCYRFAFYGRQKRCLADFREQTPTRTIPLFKIQQDSFDSPLSAYGYVAVLMKRSVAHRMSASNYLQPSLYVLERCESSCILSLWLFC